MANRSVSLRQRLTKLPREARDTLFLLLVLSWVLMPLTATLPLWASALAYGLLLWRASGWRWWLP